MKQAQKGFTLIELMIVVAIIGILAAVALPAYQDYTVRAQASEGPTLAAGLRTAIAEYYADRGDWPENNAALGISGDIEGNYVSSVEIDDGVIEVTYGNNANTAQLDGETLTIRPAISSSGNVSWICGSGAVPSSLTAVGSDNTSVQAKHLPAACRP